MGARHVDSLERFLKAEARRGFVTTQKRFFTTGPPEARQQIEGIDTQSPSRVFQFRRLLSPGTVAARMTVQSLPGCCGVCVLHSFSGDTKSVVEFIKTGVRAAKRAGYGQVVFTLRSDSAILLEFQPATADITDVTLQRLFRNGKTNNNIVMVSIDLQQPERQPTRNDTAGE